MMRCGKTLGTLDLKTDKIYLMSPSKPESNKEYLKKIMDGKFIKD